MRFTGLIVLILASVKAETVEAQQTSEELGSGSGMSLDMLDANMTFMTETVQETLPAERVETSVFNPILQSTKAATPRVSAEATSTRLVLTSIPSTDTSTSQAVPTMTTGPVEPTPVPTTTSMKGTTTLSVTSTPLPIPTSTTMLASSEASDVSDFTISQLGPMSIMIAVTTRAVVLETIESDTPTDRLTTALATVRPTTTPDITPTDVTTTAGSDADPTTTAERDTDPTTTAERDVDPTTTAERDADVTTTADPTTTGGDSDSSGSSMTTLLIVLGVIIFLIFLFFIVICVFAALLIKNRKGDDHVKRGILSTWEQKDLPVHDSGGVRFMRIRTLDEEPENRSALVGGDGVSGGAVLRSTENAYEISNTTSTFEATVHTNTEVSEGLSTFGITGRANKRNGNSENQNVGEDNGSAKQAANKGSSKKTEYDAGFSNPETTSVLESPSTFKAPATTFTGFEPIPALNEARLDQSKKQMSQGAAVSSTTPITENQVELEQTTLSREDVDRALGGSTRELEVTTQL